MLGTDVNMQALMCFSKERPCWCNVDIAKPCGGWCNSCSLPFNMEIQRTKMLKKRFYECPCLGTSVWMCKMHWEAPCFGRLRYCLDCRSWRSLLLWNSWCPVSSFTGRNQHIFTSFHKVKVRLQTAWSYEYPHGKTCHSLLGEKIAYLSNDPVDGVCTD